MFSRDKVEGRPPRGQPGVGRWPFEEKPRASWVPIPADAPVISVTRSVMHSAVRRYKGHLQARYPLAEPPPTRGRLDRKTFASQQQLVLAALFDLNPRSMACAPRQTKGYRGNCITPPTL